MDDPERSRTLPVRAASSQSQAACSTVICDGALAGAVFAAACASARHDFASDSRAKVLRIFLPSRAENTDASQPALQLQRLPWWALQPFECRFLIPSAISAHRLALVQTPLGVDAGRPLHAYEQIPSHDSAL